MSTSICAIQNGQNCTHQVPRGLLAQFNRDACRGSLCLVHKIYIQSVFQWGIEWMVVGNIRLLKLEPSAGAFSTSVNFYFFNDHCAHIFSFSNVIASEAKQSHVSCK